ncbi:MAG: hypothetical protein ACLGI8_04540 [Acidimicrobiia bacterium]
MSPKQPSKQKRAAQNRAQRAAREARKAAARTPTGSGASTSAARRSGGLLSRLRGGGGGSTRAGASAGGRRPTLAEARALQPPGYRAALSAVFAAVAAIILCSFLLRYPVDGQGDLYTSETLVADWVATALDAAQADPGLDAAGLADSIEEWTPGRADKTVVTALWPWSIAIVLPLIGAGIAYWAVRRRSPSKVLNRALYATLFGAVLTQGLLLLFIPVVLAVGVAMFQVRKAEAQGLLAAGADDGVIDVDGEELEVDDGAEDEPDELEATDTDTDPEADANDDDDLEVGPGDAEVIDAVVVERAEADADASGAGVDDRRSP